MANFSTLQHREVRLSTGSNAGSRQHWLGNHRAGSERQKSFHAASGPALAVMPCDYNMS